MSSMTIRQPLLLSLLLVVSLPAGCKRSSESPLPAQPKPADPATEGGATVAAPAGAGVQAQAAPLEPADPAETSRGGDVAAKQGPPSSVTCRALVDLDMTRPEGSGAPGGYHVADVRFGARDPVKVAPGIVVRDGERTFGLTIERHQARERNKFGSLALDWDVIVATRLPGGVREPWLEQRPMVELPDDPDDLPAVTDLDGQITYDIVGVTGPYVGLSVGDGGFGGGAHGYDDSRFATIRAGGSAVELLPLLGEPARTALGKSVVQAGEDYRAGDGWGDAPTLDANDTGTSLALAPMCDHGGPCVRGNFYCCTWAENHNMIEITAAIPELPAALRPFATPEKGEPPMLVAPDGCGAIGVEGGSLVLRSGATGPVTRHPLGKGDARLLGVAWVPADDPFDLATLPSPRSHAGTAAELVEAARARVKEKRHAEAVELLQAAAERAPEDARVQTELGYAALLVGDLALSESASNKALTLSTEDKQRGAILYNLGRLAEEQGKPDAAVGYYERSVGVRPNKTVSKRLEALRPSEPPAPGR